MSRRRRTTTRCNREPELVAKVAKIKHDQVMTMRDDARTKVRNMKITIKNKINKEQYMILLK